MKQYKYKYIFEELQSEIINGKYMKSGKLPTEEILANHFDVSRQTIRQAIMMLEKAGIVSRRQGSGTYILPPLAKDNYDRTVAVISTYIEGYIFPSMIRGISDVLTKKRFTLSLFATNNCVSEERVVLKTLLLSCPAGIIVDATKSALPNPNIDLYKQLIHNNVPIVFINGCYPELENETISVVMDDDEGGYMLTKYLYEHGHSKIAGIFKSDDIQGPKRYGGYVRCHLDFGISFQDNSVRWYSDPSRIEALLDNQEHFLNYIRKHTALICYNEEIAIPLLQFLQKQNIYVPKDLAVCSFDNSSASDITPIKITSLNHPKDRLGNLAATKLLHLIVGRKEISDTMKWTIVEKESC